MKKTITSIICLLITASHLVAEEPSASNPLKNSDQLISHAQETQVKATEMLNDYQKRVKITRARTDLMLKREEDLMTREEKNATRYEKILAKWEKQQAQFQSFLDSLKKK